VRGLDALVEQAQIPANWARDMLDATPETETEVLTQAAALLSTFLAVSRTGRSTRGVAPSFNDDRIAQLTHQLILLGGSPPTTRNIDALTLLGGISHFRFEQTKRAIGEALRQSPLGFRAWRVVTKLVRTSKPDVAHIHELKAWARSLLKDAETMRPLSLYPGRSLDLELAISVPATWSPPADDWVAHALTLRARNVEATLRERGTAAHALWTRGLKGGGQPPPVEDLIALISDRRPDIDSGLAWVKATLADAVRTKSAICNTYPDDHNPPWRTVVNEARDNLEHESLPSRIRPGAKRLFEHVLLQNSGVDRRRAIDTLGASGWVEPITNSLGSVLRHSDSETWLRVRALFALGFLQHPTQDVRRDLGLACRKAHQQLTNSPTQALVSELHAGMFAIGDCFGTPVAKTQVKQARDEVKGILEDVAWRGFADEDMLFPVARASAYVLCVTAQNRASDEQDLSQVLLQRLAGHPDTVTQDLSNWALGFRFPDDGSIQPLFKG
jgi:hypothetical protein